LHLQATLVIAREPVNNVSTSSFVRRFFSAFWTSSGYTLENVILYIRSFFILFFSFLSLGLFLGKDIPVHTGLVRDSGVEHAI